MVAEFVEETAWVAAEAQEVGAQRATFAIALMASRVTASPSSPDVGRHRDHARGPHEREVDGRQILQADRQGGPDRPR